MTNKKKIALLILLFATFLVPQIIQNYHALTVHHHIAHCDASCSDTTHFHIATEHCPIHEFIFNIVSSNGFLPVVPKPFVEKTYFAIAKEEPIKQLSFHFYFLRAPPPKIVF